MHAGLIMNQFKQFLIQYIGINLQCRPSVILGVCIFMQRSVGFEL